MVGIPNLSVMEKFISRRLVIIIGLFVLIGYLINTIATATLADAVVTALVNVLLTLIGALVVIIQSAFKDFSSEGERSP